VTKTVSRSEIETAIEAVRETGKLASAYDVLGKWKGPAFFYFNPKLRQQIRKIAKSRPRLICRPAIIITPGTASQLIDRINAVVPRTLPRDMRDDIIGEMTLAVIEGRLKIEDVESRAAEFVRASFKADHNRWGALSLDKPIFEDGTMTLGDTITRGLWSE
jgi:hypothetical protein